MPASDAACPASMASARSNSATLPSSALVVRWFH